MTVITTVHISLQLLVNENKRVRNKIPELLSPLMDLHFEKVDKAISPGLTLIQWTSINLDAFISSVTTSLGELELLINRLIDTHELRIMVPFKEIEDIYLFEIPESSTMKAPEVYSTTNKLCLAATATIELKSQVVERAVQEMIGMLTGPEIILETVEDTETPGALTVKRKMDQRTKLMQEAVNLQHFYEQALVDSQFRLLRFSLETIRRRLAVSMLIYGETQKDKPENPLFEADLILAVPNIIMKPSLDDIQQWLNKTVNAILSTTRGVYRWGQQRHHTPIPPEGERPTQSRSMMRSRCHISLTNSSVDGPPLNTFYRLVSENKELQKLASLLSTAINSTKRVFTMTIKNFSTYSHLWTVEREIKMKEFMEKVKPGVNEFCVEMNDYAQLGDVIATEPDMMTAGAVALSVEKLKLALSTEARAWVILYGRTMNHKYQTIMEEVFRYIDDWTKKLNHPLKDLDDVRNVMATLKDVREKEIQIDISLDPIEVSTCGYSRLILVMKHLHDFTTLE